MHKPKTTPPDSTNRPGDTSRDGGSEVKPDAPSRNPQVTPLDDDKKVEDGIEVNET